MSVYEQIYNGDEKNVGRIIGQSGYNITAFKNSLPTNEGIILWMHWETSNKTWIVRGTTRKVVSKAINWILDEEKRFHMLEYEQEQVKALEMMEVKELEIIRHPANLERQHAGGWTNSSDNLDWRNQPPPAFPDTVEELSPISEVHPFYQNTDDTPFISELDRAMQLRH